MEVCDLIDVACRCWVARYIYHQQDFGNVSGAYGATIQLLIGVYVDLSKDELEGSGMVTNCHRAYQPLPEPAHNCES